MSQPNQPSDAYIFGVATEIRQDIEVYARLETRRELHRSLVRYGMSERRLALALLHVCRPAAALRHDHPFAPAADRALARLEPLYTRAEDAAYSTFEARGRGNDIIRRYVENLAAGGPGNEPDRLALLAYRDAFDLVGCMGAPSEAPAALGAFYRFARLHGLNDGASRARALAHVAILRSGHPLHGHAEAYLEGSA